MKRVLQYQLSNYGVISCRLTEDARNKKLKMVGYLLLNDRF